MDPVCDAVTWFLPSSDFYLDFCFLILHSRCLSSRQKYCQALRANLASVHNAYEYRMIQRMIWRNTHAYGRTWLGGSDCQKVYYQSFLSLILCMCCFHAVLNSVVSFRRVFGCGLMAHVSTIGTAGSLTTFSGCSTAYK